MLVFLVLGNCLLCRAGLFTESQDSLSDDFGEKLVSSLRNEANLDLPVDEEYEDLRAELLAYHTALASLSSSGRRSMMTTPCWELGGICVDYKLCSGFRFLTEVPGCKNRHNVCCFTWNKFKVSHFKDVGIGNLDMPWSDHQKFGGLGILDAAPELTSKERRKKERRERREKKKSSPNLVDRLAKEGEEVLDQESDPSLIVLLS